MANWNLYDLYRRRTIEQDTAFVIESNNIYCALVTGSYTPNLNTDQFWSTPEANQVSGTNYTAGGNVCATAVIALDGSGNITLDAADPAAWSQHASGFSNARRAVLYYKRGGASSADELIAVSDDFGADRGNVAGDFSILLHASGIYVAAR